MMYCFFFLSWAKEEQRHHQTDQFSSQEKEENYEDSSTEKMKKSRKRRFATNWVWSTLRLGTKPPAPYVNFTHRLLHFTIPRAMLQIESRNKILNPYLINAELTSLIAKSLGDPKPLGQFCQASSYSLYFQHLLWIEEMQMRLDIREYDMKRVQIMQDTGYNSNLCIIEVPGLAEKRPSVMRGDAVFVAASHEANNTSKHIHSGYVYFVNLNDIRVSFHRSLLQEISSGSLFDVQFSFTRTPLRSMHRAVADREAVDSLLLNMKNLSYSFPNAQFNPFRRGLNELQQAAVSMILSQPSTPCVIFGPPGTGKVHSQPSFSYINTLSGGKS